MAGVYSNLGAYFGRARGDIVAIQEGAPDTSTIGRLQQLTEDQQNSYAMLHATTDTPGLFGNITDTWNEMPAAAKLIAGAIAGGITAAAGAVGGVGATVADTGETFGNQLINVADTGETFGGQLINVADDGATFGGSKVWDSVDEFGNAYDTTINDVLSPSNVTFDTQAGNTFGVTDEFGNPYSPTVDSVTSAQVPGTPYTSPAFQNLVSQAGSTAIKAITGLFVSQLQSANPQTQPRGVGGALQSGSYRKHPLTQIRGGMSLSPNMLIIIAFIVGLLLLRKA